MPVEGAPDANGRLYVPVTVFSEDSARRWAGKALLDTGAQFALVHPDVVAEINLIGRGDATMHTAGGPQSTRAYITRVSVAGVFDGLLSLLQSPSVERFVLGRQFLLGTSLSIDWPAGRFELASRTKGQA